MEIIDIKKDIIENTLKPFYIFYGNSPYIMRKYIDKIKEGRKYNSLYYNVSDMIEAANSGGLLDSENIYVCFNDEEFLKSEKKTNLEIKNKIIILYYDLKKIPAKFELKYADNLVCFEKPHDDILAKYIEDACPEFIYARKLIQDFNSDELKIFNALENIKIYSEVENINVNDSYKHLIKNRVLAIDFKESVFNIIKLLGDRDKKTLLLHEELKSSLDYSPLGILSLIYNSFRAILQVKTYTGGSPIKSLGLNIFQINNAKMNIKSGGWELEEVVFAISTLKNLEEGIKTGKVKDNIAVDYFLVLMLERG